MKYITILLILSGCSGHVLTDKGLICDEGTEQEIVYYLCDNEPTNGNVYITGDCKEWSGDE